MQQLTLARNAMATRFELVIGGENLVQLRAAGEEALYEIERVESLLSLYRPSSEIAQVNARAAAEPVRVSPEVFQLLVRCREYWTLSGGAFDITIAPLVRCWGFMKGTGARPADADIAEARSKVGMNLLDLDEASRTVRFREPGMMVDLGSIGKGYALDLAAQILRDNAVTSALLHGGTSTVYAIGRDAEDAPWKVAIEKPELPIPLGWPTEGPILDIIELRDEALSVSAISGKFFISGGKAYGHLLDPRTGWPAEDAVLGCAITNSATESDALSTAVLLSREGEIEQLRSTVPSLRCLQARLNHAEGGALSVSLCRFC